jgi:FlgD Ig-like domain
MKKLQVFLLVFAFIAQSLVAGVSQQTFTIEENGLEQRSEWSNELSLPIGSSSIISRDSRTSLLWQTSDPVAIAGVCKVTPILQNSFIQWHLNDERVSLFHDTATPVWEYVVADLDFGYPIDMLEDGTVLAIGDDVTLKFFASGSGTPTWEYSIGRTISGLKLSPDGTAVYISYYDSGSDEGVVEKYEYENTTPVWTSSFTGGAQTLDMSGNGSTLIFTQYGGGNSNMWVLDSSDGSVIFQGPEYNQNNPAITNDASLIVNGDYSGYVHVYEYNNVLETYEEKWNFHVAGGGTSDWIGGMAISADGSTIAIGTLTFVSGGFDGQVYLFNSYSPTPIWVYDNFGDYVTKVDMNNDGSLIAVAGYGPLDHSTADFMLFRKESNIPVFEINTPGSMDALDLASDGSFCTVGGKAVHAREMGSGGLVYSIDCDLGGGDIAGIVNLEGLDDNSGVKVEIPELTDYFNFTDYDGNFLLESVPAGTYSVEYTKIGYISNSSLNVVVTEGETTDLGVIDMMAFGSPPLNLFASHASGIQVELNWQEPATGDAEGYNIYRKQYEMDPFPEEPIGTVGAGGTSYSDDTALPLIEYFYTTTAIVATNFQSPYSNMVQGWTSSGFVVNEISVYEGTTPTIDGTISAGEWDDAYMLDTSDFWGSYDNTIQPIGSVIGYFKMNADMTELYVAYIDYNDTELEDHDEVALYMDDNNDGVFSPETLGNEGNFWAAYYAAGNQLKFRPIYDTGGTGDIFFLPDPQLEASVAEGYLVYEFMLPIGTEPWEINPSAGNQSSLAIFVLNDNAPDPNDFDGWWPHDNINLFAPDGFGTMTYGVVPETPPFPANVEIELLQDEILVLSWDMPSMNDFDHFNIYSSIDGSAFELLDSPIGVQYFYEEDLIGSSYQFYLTTVNQMGLESEASETAEYLTVGTNGEIIPLETKLGSNYPNPFNPTTTIDFSIDKNERVELAIYNLKGQKVKQLVNDQLTAGLHSIVWNGKDDNEKQAASGIYFYKMKSGSYTKTNKMLLLK